MSRDWFRILLACVLACVLAGGWSCGTKSPEPLVERKPHVLVLGIDGLRPDALEKANTPALDRLRAAGAWTMHASTQLQTITKSGPGWCSIVTGVDADKHHVVDNDTLAQHNPEYKTLFWHAKNDLNLTMAVAPSWAFFLQLIEPDVVDYEYWENGDAGVTKWTENMLRQGDQQLTFIHFNDVDEAGHTTGFSPDNPEYIAQIEDVDSQIATLIAAVDARPTRAQEDWLFVAVTDHGGEGLDHGALNEANRRIFLILSGDRVAAGELPSATQMDVMPTILQYFGERTDPKWNLDGHAIGLK